MFLREKNKSIESLPIVEKLFNGTCYKILNNTYYIKSGKVYDFYSARSFSSWKLTPVCVRFLFDPSVLRAGTLGFRDGTLIQNAKDGKIYLISDARRNLLTKPLADYGFDWSMVVEVSDDEVQFHEEGPDS
jgi:hypothetical protein